MTGQLPAEIFRPIQDRKATIDDLSAAMREGVADGELEEQTAGLEHYFAKGIYGRRIFMKAGQVIASLVHRNSNITIVLTGRATVVSDDGEVREICAPDVFVSPAGIQRALYIHEDSQWVTVHDTEQTDLDALRAELVCDSMAEYEQLQLEQHT